MHPTRPMRSTSSTGSTGSTLDAEAIDRAFAVVEQAQQEIAEREAAERNGQGQLPLG